MFYHFDLETFAAKKKKIIIYIVLFWRNGVGTKPAKAVTLFFGLCILAVGRGEIPKA